MSVAMNCIQTKKASFLLLIFVVVARVGVVLLGVVILSSSFSDGYSFHNNYKPTMNSVGRRGGDRHVAAVSRRQILMQEPGKVILAILIGCSSMSLSPPSSAIAADDVDTKMATTTTSKGAAATTTMKDQMKKKLAKNVKFWCDPNNEICFIDHFQRPLS